MTQELQHREMVDMVRIIGTAVLLSLTLAVGSSRAVVVQYKMSGVFVDVDVSGDMIGVVAPGHTWEAVFDVETDTADSDPNPTFGDYTDAIVSDVGLTIKDNNDLPTYSRTLTPDPGFGNIFVLNDFVSSAPTADGVQADVTAGSEFLYVPVTNEDLGTLASDALPGVGEGFGQNTSTPDVVFWYFSPGGGEVIAYSTGNAKIEIIPEPSTITLWCLAAVGLCCVWRRKRRSR